MAPKVNSRDLFCTALQQDGRIYLSDRVPYRFRPFSDNRNHEAQQGDSLFTLSGRYFQPLEESSQYWWAIGDFQPDPIIDPTVRLDEGRNIVIPSIRTLLELILNENRREDFAP